MQIVCLGDSLTDCGRLFSYQPLGNGYVSILHDRLADRKIAHTIHNCGVDGFTVARLLQNTDSRYLPLHPDVITILIGINDIGLMMDSSHEKIHSLMQKFFQTYDELLTALETQTRQIVLMEPFVFPVPQQLVTWFPYVQTMADGISALARQHGLTYLPLWQKLLEEGSLHGYETVTPDGIHLTAHGHILLANALDKVLENKQYIQK
jgi:lysophospholipase L1-like esterase